MKIIISDCHVGTTLWQKAILEQLGHTVIVQTLSSHKHYIDDNIITDNFFYNIQNYSKEYIEHIFKEKYNDVTHILCSFPPKHVSVFDNVPSNIKIILNIGHRIHIHLNSNNYKEFTNNIIDYSKNNRYIIACMSEYDFQYVKYYTNIEVIKLYVACYHLPKEINYNPTSHIILIGPSHNTNNIINFIDLIDLNNNSVIYANKHNKPPYLFNFIKSLYPNTTFENLINHPAVLLFPYSAFSISMVELYQLNIPMIVPSKNILKGKMNDVKLYPIYNNNINTINEFDKQYNKEDIPSPNSFNENDDLYWLDFMFFNKVNNSLIYNNNDQLFDIVYNTNFIDISNKMRIENNTFLNNELLNWKKILH
jgi:hypothetical protein